MSESPMPSTTRPSQARRVTPGRVGAVFALLLIVLAIFSLTVIETGQVGVVIRSGSDQARVIAEPGVSVRWPFIERVWLIDTRLQTSQQGAAQVYATADQQTVQIAGWVAWRVSDPVRFQAIIATGKAAVHERVIKAFAESLTDWAASRSAAVLIRGVDEATAQRWLTAVNQRLLSLGLQAERVGLSQLGLPDAANQAIYARMSAASNESRRQLIAGLAADERQFVDLENRQQAQVLESVYRATQQSRQNADTQLLAAYARRYGSGSANGFADALKNSPPPAEKSAP